MSSIYTIRTPRSLLLNDEGNSALHYVNLDAPRQNWTYQGPGRELQLIGHRRVLRSHPDGYVELELANRGAVVRDVVIAELPGGIETARRLPNGNTVVAGNGGGGIFVWEVNEEGAVRRRALYPGIEKARMLRRSEEGTFLFCSETNGRSLVHEADWESGVRTLYEAPDEVPADSMVKAVRIAKDQISVSTGYAASLIVVDTGAHEVRRTIGGKQQFEPQKEARPHSPFFFSGYQMFQDGSFLVSNWQGHAPKRMGRATKFCNTTATASSPGCSIKRRSRTCRHSTT